MIQRQKQHSKIVACPAREEQDDTCPQHRSPTKPLQAEDFINSCNNLFGTKVCHILKFESHNIPSVPVEKVFSSESGEKYAQIKHYLQAKKICG